MSFRPVEACVVLLLVGAASATAQQSTRVQLIERARAEPDESARGALFVEAANPEARDSLWAVSAFEVAQIMRDLGRDTLAATWLRWAVRHGEWQIDRSYFAPSLLSFYEARAGGVQDEVDPGASSTTWQWPSGFPVEEAGFLDVVTLEPVAGLTVAILGQGEFSGGASLQLAPGTYELVAAAEGSDTVRLQREILPGARTIVSVDLPPRLSEAVAQRVAGDVLSLVGAATGAMLCSNAVPIREGFAVASLSMLGDSTALRVSRLGSGDLDAEVVSRDVTRDLAVLRVPDLAGPSFATASLEGQRYGWSVFRLGCVPSLQVARSRVAGLAVAPAPQGAEGSPLVTRDGLVMGVMGRGGRFAPIDEISQLVDGVAAEVGGGGFPTLWVALGAAVAGGVTALLMSGNDPPAPGTGSIVITIPGG